MIQQRPATTDIARVGPLAAALLAAGLTVGFVAGQTAPDIFQSLGGTAASVSTTLPQNADYGIRHIEVTVPPTLTEVDDYGTRHVTTTPLTPADDYGVRHQDR